MIVTGASRGIGAGVTKAFIERGYNVVANSLHIQQSEFEPVERLALIEGDFGEASTARKIADAAMSSFGSIDGVVSNAGIFFYETGFHSDGHSRRPRALRHLFQFYFRK